MITGLLCLVILGSASAAVARHGHPTKTVTAKFSVSCDLGQFGTGSITGKVSSTVPVTGNAGSTVRAGVKGEFVLPKSLANELRSYGFTSVSGTIKTINIKSSDATPATLNAAGSGVTVPVTTIVNGHPIDLLFPHQGALTVGPWSATAEGTDTLTFGNSVVDLTFQGVTPTDVVARCAAPTKTTVLGSIAVS